MRLTKAQIKDIARDSVIAYLDAGLDRSSSHLWKIPNEVGWTAAHRQEFMVEVRRIMQRVRP